MAEGGTLFLDEIGNIPLAIQAKLLRVIQEREFRAVGDTRTQSANFRLVAAINRDLAAMVAAGEFRDDLYYRINVFPIAAPALRDRREDIPALAYPLREGVRRELGKDVDEISEGALNLLASYDWPGNVRELAERAAPGDDPRDRQRPAQGAPRRHPGGAAGPRRGQSRRPARS